MFKTESKERNCLIFLVGGRGFEPPTPGLLCQMKQSVHVRRGFR